jgi:hypothetical protein
MITLGDTKDRFLLDVILLPFFDFEVHLHTIVSNKVDRDHLQDVVNVIMNFQVSSMVGLF